jgi:DnaJ-class molecular chaperone
MAEILHLPLKCPLCDGTGKLTGIVNSSTGATTVTVPCSMCNGSGKRPTEKQLAARRG